MYMWSNTDVTQLLLLYMVNIYHQMNKNDKKQLVINKSLPVWVLMYLYNGTVIPRIAYPITQEQQSATVWHNEYCTQITWWIQSKSINSSLLVAFLCKCEIHNSVRYTRRLQRTSVTLLGHISPKLCHLSHQLTERQLDYKSKSIFPFTNVRHVHSTRNQLTDALAFSLAELYMVRFESNCCNGDTDHL